MDETNSLLSDMLGYISGFIPYLNSLAKGQEALNDSINDLNNSINDLGVLFSDGMDGMTEALTDGFGGIFDELGELRADGRERQGILAEIRDYIKGIFDILFENDGKPDGLTSVLREIRDQLKKITDGFAAIDEEELDDEYMWIRIPFLGNFRIARRHQDVESEDDNSLFAQLIRGLFVPSDGFLERKTEEFNETLEERLPVIAKIFSITDELTAAVREQTGYDEEQYFDGDTQHGGFVPAMLNIPYAFGNEDSGDSGTLSPFRIENGILMPVLDEGAAFSPFTETNTGGYAAFTTASEPGFGGGSSDGGGVGRTQVPSIKITLPPAYGGEVVDLIDFNIFAQYRPFIHGFMIVIGVVTFVIRLKKKIPRIIHS
jgi:hypothetical protein